MSGAHPTCHCGACHACKYRDYHREWRRKHRPNKFTPEEREQQKAITAERRRIANRERMRLKRRMSA